MCSFALADWQEEGKNQRRLKLGAVERWMLESRSKIQIPFRKWYLWVADALAKQHAQGLIAGVCVFGACVRACVRIRVCLCVANVELHACA